MRHINRSDGYEIVKSMESDGWCANSLLVEIMDQDFIGDAERELVHQWVRCLNLKLNIPIGTKVKINRGLSENGRIGEVVKHYPKEARYGVRTPEQADTTHWLLCPDYIEVIA